MLSKNDVVDPRGSHLETKSLRLDFIKGLFKFQKSTRHSYAPPLSLTLSTLHSHSPSPFSLILSTLHSHPPTLLSLSLHSQRLVLLIPHSHSVKSSPSLKPTLGNPFLKCLFCFVGFKFFFGFCFGWFSKGRFGFVKNLGFSSFFCDFNYMLMIIEYM